MKRTILKKVIANFLVLLSMASAIAVIPKPVEAVVDGKTHMAPRQYYHTTKEFCYLFIKEATGIDLWRGKCESLSVCVEKYCTDPRGFDAAGFVRTVFKFVKIECNDRTYVYELYRSLFRRQPASSEVDYWVNRIKQGDSREFILECFLNTREFSNTIRNLIC